MFDLKLQKNDNSPYSVLCLGAHSDDIEIGCGGTVLKLLKLHKHIRVDWVVFSASHERKKEAYESAEIFLEGSKEKNIIVKNFRDGFFPYIGSSIKEYFEHLKSERKPDLILTHYRKDLHQDHRLISKLTWNTFRKHLILEYEIPKYDGDFGTPNFFVNLDEILVSKKIDYIIKYYQSQAQRSWFDAETFRGVLRLRGIEADAPDRYAEAFYCRKMIFQ